MRQRAAGLARSGVAARAPFGAFGGEVRAHWQRGIRPCDARSYGERTMDRQGTPDGTGIRAGGRAP